MCYSCGGGNDGLVWKGMTMHIVNKISVPLWAGGTRKHQDIE